MPSVSNNINMNKRETIFGGVMITNSEDVLLSPDLIHSSATKSLIGPVFSEPNRLQFLY